MDFAVSFAFQIEQQTLMDFSTYLSGIGGNLGLFAGMSLLTVVQCFAHFLCIPCEKSKRLKLTGVTGAKAMPTSTQLYHNNYHL